MKQGAFPKQIPSPLVEAVYFPKFALNNARNLFSHEDAMTQINDLLLFIIWINQS
ncbi:MAG: hypothetical protein V1775_00920 [Bacteroidota bacterium]